MAQVVIVHSQTDLAQVDALRKTEYKNSPSRIVLVGEISCAAEHIARYQVGPPAGDVVIEPDIVSLSNDDKLLLRRAFSDCERIFLEPIVGGKASTAVFRAHAWLRKSQVGPRPLPFFVKIATPKMVNEEKSKYGLYAEHYIPFNLRPNLDLRRCVCTRAKAALVGNFVDDAVPLRRSLRSGHGVGALFAPFETSLRGFRLQPFAANEKQRENVLEGFVRSRIKLEKIPEEIITRARAFGLATDASTLRDLICEAANKVSCFFGPYHGDLHSGNIMVRGGDAILIDFSSASDGPLTAYPAVA